MLSFLGLYLKLLGYFIWPFGILGILMAFVIPACYPYSSSTSSSSFTYNFYA
jgi:hypothetical protein